MPLAPDDAVAATPEREAPDALRQEIASLYDAASSDGAAADTRTAVEGGGGSERAPADNAAASVDGGRAETPDGDRPRDAQGRFVAKEGAPEAAATEKTSVQQDATAKPDTAPSTAQDGPPVSWAADAKAAWNDAHPAIKAAAIKREAEMSAGGRQWSEEKRRYDGMLAPVAERARSYGLTVDQALNSFVSLDHGMRTNPAATLLGVAGRYGVTPEQLLSVLNGNPTDGQQSAPQGRVPQPDFSPLTQRIEAIEGFFAQQQQQQVDIVATDVQRFAADPANKYFEQVADDVAYWIPHLRASMTGSSPMDILREAYDRAVHGNPTTRAALYADRERSAEQQRTQQRNDAAQRARLAASSVTGAPNGALHHEGDLSLRDEIMRAMAAN